MNEEDLLKIFNSRQFLFGEREVRKIIEEEAAIWMKRAREIAELERML